MKKDVSSRERLLAAMNNEFIDYVPCSFMIFTGLRLQCKDHFEFVEKQLEMGLDAFFDLRFLPQFEKPDVTEITGFPVRFGDEVTTREWREEVPGEPYPLLHKEYATPSGTLTTAVQQTEDWPYRDFVPFLDDYLIPRSKKPLITSREDLPALRHLLQGPTADDIATFRDYSAKARAFADKHGVLLSGGWGACMEVACWLCGIENLMYLAFDAPDFVQELSEILTEWNHKRMEIMLEAGVDVFVRRGWYENATFWSPEMYRKFLLPALKTDVEMAHQAGAKFAYIVTMSVTPLLDMFVEAGVDALVGTDPVQGVDTRLDEIKGLAAGKICLWGGVNGFVTIEGGSPDQVREAVAEAIQVLGPGGGFILSPVDNVRDAGEKSWQNVGTFIEAWKEMRAYPITI